MKISKLFHNLSFISALLILCMVNLKAQTLIHSYELNGTYADDFGGSPIVPNGGTLTSTSYEFEGGEGPNLSNVINPISYTLEMNFTLSETNYWRKLVDFKDGNSDNGIYVNDQRLFLYPDSWRFDPVIEAGIPNTLRITRDGATKMVTIFVNGIEHINFEDTFNNATFSEPGNIIQLMRDDFRTPPLEGHDPENPSGSLDYVKIYKPDIDPCGIADSDCDGVSNACDICTGGDDLGPCNLNVLPPLNELPSYWLCSNNNNTEKVTICHSGTTLCVSESAANTHLSHGDYLGPCTSCSQNYSAPLNHISEAEQMPEVKLCPGETKLVQARPLSGQGYIFPNPASEKINIVLPEVDQESTLRILSLTGQEIHVLHLQGQQSITFDLSSYTAGIYLIDVRSANGHYQKKFVKL